MGEFMIGQNRLKVEGGTQDKKIMLYTVFDYMVPDPCGVYAESCLECTLDKQ